MKREAVLQIYDDPYAASYDDLFLLGEEFRECTAYEERLLRSYLGQSKSWLDIGCGTGYFLSRFPGVERCGLDISPAMVSIARRANPDATIIEGDYRYPFREWHGRWSLVSCMWYAYCYAGSIDEVEAVFENLAAWTAPGGTCFVPLCDPDVLAKTHIAYRPPADSADGELQLTAVVWNWTDLPSGKLHRGLIAPHAMHLTGLLARWFSDVSVEAYPQFERDCLASRQAVLARGRVS